MIALLAQGSERWSYEPKVLGSIPREGILLFLFASSGAGSSDCRARRKFDRVVGAAFHVGNSHRPETLRCEDPGGLEPQIHVLNKEGVEQSLVLHVLPGVFCFGLQFHDAFALYTDGVLEVE